MSKQANTEAKPTVTEQLWSLFDQVGADALSLNFAQALAEANGLNRTSASIALYRWKAARTAEAQPA